MRGEGGSSVFLSFPARCGRRAGCASAEDAVSLLTVTKGY